MPPRCFFLTLWGCRHSSWDELGLLWSCIPSTRWRYPRGPTGFIDTACTTVHLKPTTQTLLSAVSVSLLVYSCKHMCIETTSLPASRWNVSSSYFPWTYWSFNDASNTSNKHWPQPLRIQNHTDLWIHNKMLRLHSSKLKMAMKWQWKVGHL